MLCECFFDRLSTKNDLLQVLEHVGSAKQHGGGVGDVPAYRLGERVTGTLAQRRRRRI